MHKNAVKVGLLILIGLLFFSLPAGVALAQDEAPTAALTADGLAWDLVGDNFGVALAVNGPDDYMFDAFFATGETPVFSTAGLADGQYKFELVAFPEKITETQAALRNAIDLSDRSVVYAELIASGQIPAEVLTRSGVFTISGGEVVDWNLVEEDETQQLIAQDPNVDVDSAFELLDVFEPVPQPVLSDRAVDDFVINDDLIVDGSACIGFDCVNGESFGFDTLRLKENNLRIKFMDTSNTASFPTNDWQLTANDSTNGGADKFSIDDIDGGRTPFTIEAGARTNALYVEDTGRIGLGTNNPYEELHIKAGDTPGIRLEQDGSYGWTPQTWDVASNETNFFIRDVTQGSKLPFRIRPGAPTSSLDIMSNGDIGLGTASPAYSLELERTGVDAVIAAQRADTSASAQLFAGTNPEFRFVDPSNSWFIFMKTSSGRFNITDDPAQTRVPLKIGLGADNNLLRVGIPNTNEVNITGNLVVSGDCTETDGACAPDYVFAPAYNMLSLAELEQYIAVNKHLPNVPSGAELDATGINVQAFSYTLLEKVEELTLYTLQQEQTINALEARLDVDQAPAQVSITVLLPWTLLTIALVALAWTYGKRQAQVRK